MGTVSPSLLSSHTNDSHISAAKYIKEGEFNMDQNINFYGIILMSASFWVPAAQGRLHPSKVKMLGRSEFALCQDFCFAKMLVRRKRAAPPCGDPVGPASFLSTQDNPQSFAFELHPIC